MNETIPLDNQDIDLTGVDISRPLLPQQQLKCRIGEVTMEKNEKGLRNLILPLHLEQPGVDTKGQPVNVGFVVTDRLLLDPTGKLTTQMINERLARLQVAALGMDKPGRLVFSELIGKEVLVTFDVRNGKNPDGTPSTEQFQDVKRYTRAA